MKRFVLYLITTLVITMGLFSFFRKTNAPEISDALPWNEGESIYRFVKSRIDPVTHRYAPPEDKLPDEDKRYKPGQPRWVAGGLDGAFGHHGGGGANEELSTRIAELLVNIARDGSTKEKIELYHALETDSVLDCLDPAIAKMVKQRPAIEPYLHDYVRELATKSPDREPVKFAISILGLIRDHKDIDIITTLGRHEEFTLFSAVALDNSLDDPAPELYKLAQCVEGWGRVHLVERLAKTTDAKIKRWLLREGYKNSIMYEYTAFVCATTGGLREELAADKVDAVLFDAAGDLINALLVGGPAQDISGYADAAVVFQRYLDHLRSFPRKLEYYQVLEGMSRYLDDPKWEPTERQKNGWTEELRGQCRLNITAYLVADEWRGLAETGLLSSDPVVFYKADLVAGYLKIDTWAVHWKRLHDAPEDSGRWFSVMKHANAARIDEILSFAESAIALPKIATGLGDELGLGSTYALHSCLDSILQELTAYPGRGKRLILAGLRSPVVRNRNMALKALAVWDRTTRDGEIEAALVRALAEEPNDTTRDLIKKTIAGEIIQ